MDIVNQAKLLMISLGAAPVMWLMLALSVASIAVIVERGIYFLSVRTDFAVLSRSFSQHLAAGDLTAAQLLLKRSRGLEAEVVAAGLAEAARGVTAAREAMAGVCAAQRPLLDRRLGFLGTLGNNAPFIGLFGTVIGIILAFEELSRAGAGAAATAGVMASIAEALVATAIGLLVAIPAVAAYNVYQRRIRKIAANTEALSRILLVHLERSHALRAAEPAAARASGARRPLVTLGAEG